MDPPVNENSPYIQIYLLSNYKQGQIPVRLRRDDPISVIYEIAEEIFNIPIFMQIIEREGLDSPLHGSTRDIRKISELAIDDKDRIIVNKQHPHGGGFDLLSFVSLFGSNEKVMESDRKAPLWRTVFSGLNLSGTCYNNVCEAFRQRVWVPKNFGTFQMRRESTDAKCVRCSQQLINVINCGFVNCIFTIEGNVSSGASLNIVNREAPDDKFLTFNDVTENQTIQYEYLKITTTPKSGSAGASSLVLFSRYDTAPKSDSGCNLL